MMLLHSKNLYAIIEVGLVQIPAKISNIRLNGSDAVKIVHYKGKKIADTLRSQPIVSISCDSYIKNSAMYRELFEAYTSGLSVTISILSLTPSDTNKNKLEIIPNFIQSQSDGSGLIAQATGHFSNVDFIGQSGEYVMFRFMYIANDVFGQLL
jgi:hypothetical protein